MHGRGFAARWGGEKFLPVYERTDIDRAYSLLKTLLDNIRALAIKYNDQFINDTMTLGAAPGNNCDTKDLLRAADEKLYKCKNSGRNQAVR